MAGVVAWPPSALFPRSSSAETAAQPALIRLRLGQSKKQQQANDDCRDSPDESEDQQGSRRGFGIGGRGSDIGDCQAAGGDQNNTHHGVMSKFHGIPLSSRFLAKSAVMPLPTSTQPRRHIHDHAGGQIKMTWSRITPGHYGRAARELNPEPAN